MILQNNINEYINNQICDLGVNMFKLDWAKIKSNGFIHLLMSHVFFVSGVITNTLQCINFVTVRQFSKYWYRRVNFYICYAYYAQLVFMAEWWGSTKVYLYTDKDTFKKYFGKEHTWGIMNHTYEVDWLIGWVVLDKIGMLGNCKAYAKKSIQNIPILGWSWWFSEFVFLERSFEKDKDEIKRQVTALADHPDPIWLIFYPEGTRPTPSRLLKSQAFAKEHNFPMLKHHLFPRTKGFVASVPLMRDKMGALYDMVLAFKPHDKPRTTFHSLLNGDSLEAHLYIKRIPFEEVPENEEAVKFLHDMFVRKDKIQDSFQNTGDFFAESGVERVEPIVIQRRMFSLVVTLIWSCLTLLPVLYFWLILLFQGEFFYFFLGVFICYILYILLHKALDKTKINSVSLKAWNTTCVKKQFEQRIKLF